MTKHRVPITSEHITDGLPGNPRDCPAALALRSPRTNGPRFRNPYVGFRTTTLDHEPFNPTDVYTNTQSLTDWIREHDQSKKKDSLQQSPGPATLVIDTALSTIDLIRRSPAG